MKKSNITFGDLFGSEVEVLMYPDRNVIGLIGIVENETQKTISIYRNKKTITLFKDYIVFKIRSKNSETVIYGNEIVGRPEDRTKEVIKKKIGLR
jgi:RNase P/RNase MRP subunit p29